MSTRKNVASAPIVYKILQLIDHFRGDPTPHFSDSWIAKRVGEQVEDVQLALARMRDDAWLAVQRGPDGTAAYWLTRDGGRPALAEARANPRLRLNLTIWKNEVLTGMREGTPPKGDPQGGSWQQTEITRAALPSQRLEQHKRDTEGEYDRNQRVLDELRELAKKFSVQPAKLNRMMQTGEIGYCESCGEVEKFSERLDGSDNMRRDCKKCRAKKERVRRAGR